MIDGLLFEQPTKVLQCLAFGNTDRRFTIGHAFDLHDEDRTEQVFGCEIVSTGNHSKFTQNADLKATLFATAGTTLVEASPYDRIWGVGLAEDDLRIRDRKKWRGQNRLGEILTQLREDLMKK